jgi:DNA integrity scanning protein DisA with diadenylate cyclase activity
MDNARYGGASAAAPRVAAHFANHIKAAQRDGLAAAAAPSVLTVETIIDAAFWASLHREEGYTPRISLAYLPPEQTVMPMLFERPIALLPATLSKVSPAVERAGIHLGIWERDGELSVWGTTRAIPMYCFVLEVMSPGLLVVKHHRGEESAKFVNVAVLEGDRLMMIDEKASSLPDCPPLLTSLLGFDAPASWAQSLNVLVQLAASMREHRRGGALLVVPSGSDSWRESIVQPIVYGIRPFFSELADLMQEPRTERRRWQESLARAVDAVAGLTAVDGATIITDKYELLAFGAKIGRRDGSPRIESVMVTEPIEGSTAQAMNPSEMGGTRHLSAAQFVHDQQNAVALVASQDGRFTIFAWSPCEASVHAHRVEALLL